MRANNAGDFLRMLNPDDCIYGFKKLSNWDLDKVIKLYKDRGVLRGVSDRDEARKILWDSTYQGDRRDVYGEDTFKLEKKCGFAQRNPAPKEPEAVFPA